MPGDEFMEVSVPFAVWVAVAGLVIDVIIGVVLAGVVASRSDHRAGALVAIVFAASCAWVARGCVRLRRGARAGALAIAGLALLQAIAARMGVLAVNAFVFAALLLPGTADAFLIADRWRRAGGYRPGR